MLLVAPLSGHFATLLRNTVSTLLADHDVYVTDWHNLRDVPLAAGPFGFDHYIEHVIQFLEALGPGVHVMAVCQPCVQVLAAIATMAADGNPAQPLSMTLMAGPIDTRINPTRVNELATSKPIEWFRKHLIATVPMRYKGAGRKVYPGFVQLLAFTSMNLERHKKAHRDLHDHLVKGEVEQADAIRTSTTSIWRCSISRPISTWRRSSTCSRMRCWPRPSSTFAAGASTSRRSGARRC